MHQVAGTGEQQQTLGIQVQATNGQPLALKQLGQFTKNRWPVLRVIVANNFTGWLVISENARRRRGNLETNGFAIDFDMISKLNALADMCRLIVDRNPPL